MKMERELQTVRVMIDLYCRHFHGGRDALCSECRALTDYVRKRLERCPFSENKPRCSQCSVHCYRPDMRERIKEVMRYAGPRMIYRHPILTVRHYLKKNVK